jgi:hypothetical protein
MAPLVIMTVSYTNTIIAAIAVHLLTFADL